MSNAQKEAWRQQYRATSEALARARCQELAALTDADVLRQIQSLRPFGPIWRVRPDWSGLVEQQAIFHRRCKP